MTSERDAFSDYLDVLDRVRGGSMTIDEAVAYIEKISGPEYAEIARESLLDLIQEEIEKGWSK